MKYFNLVISFMVLIALNINISFTAEITANIARTDLTPPLEMKFASGGYGARMSKPAEGIHDRIWAKALVMSDGQKKYAVVTLDILALPPNVKPQVVKNLADQNWSEKNILMLPSHTHTSLDMTALNNKNLLNIPQIGIYQPELLEFLVNKLVSVIKEADQHLLPVKIGTTREMVVDMNRNRRGSQAVDQDLTVTRIDLIDGKPLAVLVNWTAHPTLMDEKDMWVSGGWPGYLQRELEGWIGDEVTVMYYNGAEGDLSPIRPTGASHFEQAESYGRRIAIKAMETFRRIEPDKNPEFKFIFQTIKLPNRVAHPLFKTTGGAEYGIDDKAMEIILNMMCPDLTGIGILQLGDLMIVGVPGELSADLGILVKQNLIELGIKNPVIGGFANEWISYILSQDEYNKGGYEASVSFYGPDLGDTIVQGMLDTARLLIK